ncbi:conjugal transfer protein TraM [Nitrosovibrio sp. Nv4]|uniref:conjugal transfer protein TraM n=1 Tax=Nitrosovibrio sp. Nv4 TaxID=1945880 RepID=UPI000BD990DE|nr:conjugal transfer protein TraM [Nitrosovibrio sp. Nv4]SOD41937.1 Transcriptional activator TraM [Nitrosovibrio sp. Nv4]SOD42761.1 Transcriptional activator TraM [Nitrosovibrio sp. Nv4]
MTTDLEGIDEIIKEVAVKHNIMLSRDDPILMLYTINKQLMTTSKQAQEGMLQEFRKELETIAQRWGNEASNQANKTLNSTVASMRDMITTTIREETDAAMDRLAAGGQRWQRLNNLNLLASVLTLAAAAIVLWVAAGN